MELAHAPTGRALRSRRVAAVLGLLLGGLGCHRFYLGYTKVGLVQFAVTGGSFVTALVLGRATGATWGDAAMVGLGVAALGMLWGFFEGVAILFGGMDRDAHDHPLVHPSPPTTTAVGATPR